MPGPGKNNKRKRDAFFFVAVHIYLEGKKGKEEEKSTQKTEQNYQKGTFKAERASF